MSGHNSPAGIFTVTLLSRCTDSSRLLLYNVQHKLQIGKAWVQSYFTGSLLSHPTVMVWCVGRGVCGLVGASLTPHVTSALGCNNKPLPLLPEWKKSASETGERGAGGGAGRSLNPLESSAPWSIVLGQAGIKIRLSLFQSILMANPGVKTGVNLHTRPYTSLHYGL